MVRRGGKLSRACESVLLKQLRPGDGGLIAAGANGDAVIAFTTEGMFHGLLRQGDEQPRVGIWEGAGVARRGDGRG
jgi:isoaspartyl peptidase/L-asparaginase-like protein (Ntn-hydrolase superfamily)